MKPKMKTYFKIAHPDGFDFKTGKTINYRETIGKLVKCPGYDGKGALCTSTVIHASLNPDDCFQGGKIPCSVYKVTGIPVVKSSDKCGFAEFMVVKELDPKKAFKWNYERASNPVHPFKIVPPEKITEKHLQLLKEWASVWASVRASVGASVWASVGDSVRASVGDSVRASVGDSVWASVGDSVWASVGAYIGSIFIPVVQKWKHVKNTKGKYPFQSAVDLWEMGLVPSYDGAVWKLHGGPEGKPLWEGKL